MQTKTVMVGFLSLLAVCIFTIANPVLADDKGIDIAKNVQSILEGVGVDKKDAKVLGATAGGTVMIVVMIDHAKDKVGHRIDEAHPVVPGSSTSRADG
jgi:hypothetical protein